MARRLRKQEVLAYPTESCFGLGCDPFDRRAVQRVLRIKGRPQIKGLILIAADVRQLALFVDAGALRAADAAGYWPGPVTLLLPAARRCPTWVRGRHASVAVRVTAHPAARDVCRRYGCALVSTSANRSGEQPVRTTRELARRMGASRVHRFNGRVGGAKRPSRIIDWVSGRTIRE